jgi:hypothetical protein
MTGYSLKGTITFWILVVLTILSGGALLPFLIIGIITYQLGGLLVRSLTGYDPRDGTTANDRKRQESINQIIIESRLKSDPVFIAEEKRQKAISANRYCEDCHKIFVDEVAFISHKDAKHKNKTKINC